MSFEVLLPDDAAWLSLLDRVPHDVYHLPGYAAVCATHESWPVQLAVAQCADEVLVMPFMRRALPRDIPGCDIAVPYGYPGPVCSSEDPVAQEALLTELFQGFAAMDAVSAFIRCHPFLGVGLPALSRFGDVMVHGDQVFLDLPALPGAIETSFRAGHRQDVDKLRRVGFSIRVDAPCDAEVFPSLYDLNMIRLAADAYYHFPTEYFDAIRVSLAKNVHFVAAISPEGDVAAIALVLACGPMAQYHLACTEDRFLRLAPSKLTILGMAGLCRDLGVRTLNLGGGVGAQADGLLTFKAGFSRSRVPFATSRVVLDAARYASLSAGVDAPPEFFPAYRTGL